MSSIAGDFCDYNMGDYDCSEGFYGYEVEGDCGGYENSHDKKLGRFEGHYFRRENEGDLRDMILGEKMRGMMCLVLMVNLEMM